MYAKPAKQLSDLGNFEIFIVRQPSFDFSGPKQVISMDECLGGSVSRYRFRQQSDYDAANRFLTKQLEPVQSAAILQLPLPSEPNERLVVVKTRGSKEWQPATAPLASIIDGSFVPEGVTAYGTLLSTFSPYSFRTGTIYVLPVQTVAERVPLEQEAREEELPPLSPFYF